MTVWVRVNIGGVPALYYIRPESLTERQLFQKPKFGGNDRESPTHLIFLG